MRIKAKLFLFAILCSVFPLVVTFTFSFNAANNSLTKTVKQNLRSLAAEQLESLQRDLAASKHELGTLSKLSNMQYVLGGDLAGSLQKDLDTFAKRTPLFAEIVVADYNGIAVAGTLKKYVNTDFSGTWEFEAPKLGINFDGRVVKSYRLDKNIATQSVPLYSSVNPDQIIGALIGSIDWEFLQQELASHTVFGHKQNRQRQVFLESLESDSILYGTSGVNVPVQLLSDRSDDSGIKRVILDGRDYMMVSINSRPYDEFRDPRWRLHVLLDTKIAYASAEELKNYFLLAGGLVLLLVLTLGILFARSIVIPVKSLATGAERLAAGDYAYKLPENNARDEIGQLTQSFNSMRVAVRRNEQELVSKTAVAEQAARLKGEFLANMSHEVRTPINGVLGMTELLLNTSLDSTQSRYAKSISRSGQVLLAVINDILDFSKIEAGKLELFECAFDLRDLVEDVVEMIADSANKKGVEVALLMSPGSHVAFNGDSARLRQVLLNLLSNAVKFTAKGKVQLLVSCGELKQGTAPISFKVVDTGIGIEPENQKKIFDSFVQADGTTTREFGGTGLGLAISTKLMSLMGGEISVSSAMGQGSEFWFEIELEQLASSAELAWRTPDTLLGKRVLIVDDDQLSREVLETQMDFWGAESLVVASAAEALQEMELVAGTDKAFDAAVFDMHMPVMNGSELIDVVHDKQLAPETKLILLSSACDNHDLQASRSIAIHSQVKKPFRQYDLYNCLTAAFNGEGVIPLADKFITKKIESSTVRGHVLLAEDNPISQDMMLEMLRLIGLTVELACNGEEVLNAIEKHRFDLVLMDCQMPVLDGFAATNRIRQSESSSADGKHVPIIALTANAMQGDRERCLSAGMDDYLSKPVSSQQLKDIIGGWLGQVDTTASAVVELESDAPTNSEKNLDITANIDERVFSELMGMCEKAPAGFYSQLVQKFEESTFADLNLMAEAIDREDTRQVASIAHRLKSSSGNWGAHKLTELLQALELASKNGAIEHAPVLAKQILSEHENLLQFLRIRESKAA